MHVVTRMHIDELDITDGLVRRLLTGQFPSLARLSLRRLDPGGTVHVIYRLGDDLSVRLPRRRGPTTAESTELEWLPRLAPLLPVEIPVPVAQGRPSEEYPWFWEIHRWVEGETLPVDTIDAAAAACDLAAVVRALQAISPAGAPRGRGIPLAERDPEFRAALARLGGDPVLAAAWERALAAPAWDGPPVWHHGDLDQRNWVVRNGRIAGVIDWGSMGIGDPACDVMVAWKLHSQAARDAFREVVATDDATWERARAWAFSQSVIALAYYTTENNPALYHEARAWQALVRSEL